MIVKCPWPEPSLSPNSRTHWGIKARAAKSYRHTCATLAREQGVHLMSWPDGSIDVHLTFCAPDKRKRDDDNFEAAFKSGRDGIADAMGVDDNRFKVTRSVGDPVVGGCVFVEIAEPCIFPKGAGMT
jgi:crossover junction endodeoxyribonuclease RusA